MFGSQRRKATALGLAALLVLAACGGGDSTATTEEPAGLPATTADEPAPIPEPAGATTTTVAVEVEECDDPEATEFSLSEPEEGQVEAGGRMYFCVEVPGGVSSLTVTLTNMTDDLTVYVGYPDLQTVKTGGTTFWYSEEEGTADEVLVIKPGLADHLWVGPYYIEVSAFESNGSSGFTLTVEAG
ncbi:MAG: hypothetical protein U9N56_10970 [Actinomycetota bacterium]|nr:hypothetical protein [Actinomycetota bacterium]